MPLPSPGRSSRMGGMLQKCPGSLPGPLTSTAPALLNVGVGRHVRESLGKDWCVLEGTDCWQEEFAAFIAGFFARRSPLVRIERRS